MDKYKYNGMKEHGILWLYVFDAGISFCLTQITAESISVGSVNQSRKTKKAKLSSGLRETTAASLQRGFLRYIHAVIWPIAID